LPAKLWPWRNFWFNIRQLKASEMANNWITYSNRGVRNLPLSPELVSALSFLPEMGLGIEVFSGGQPGSGPHRTGSHRHDYGGAGDVYFTRGGERLNWANAAEVPIYQEIVRRAKARGVTGFGAGPGYMPQGSMHIGFGSPAVWGAGGSSANAPGWLRSAYGSAQGGPVPQAEPQASQSGQAPGFPQQQPFPFPMPAPVNNVASIYRNAIFGGDQDWMQNKSYSFDALASDFLAGRNPMRRFIYQKLFA
jgi:hypothetical protein